MDGWMIFLVVTGEWSTSCLIVYVRGCTNILVLVQFKWVGRKGALWRNFAKVIHSPHYYVGGIAIKS